MLRQPDCTAWKLSLPVLSAVLLLLLLGGGCSAGSVYRLTEGPATAPQGAELLPSVAGLGGLGSGRGRQGSYVEADLHVSGANFEAALPAQKVDKLSQPGDCIFSPQNGAGTKGAAYAIYAFSAPDYDRQSWLVYTLASAPADYGRVFLGLANWGQSRWDWFAADASQRLELPSFAPYFDGAGRMYVTVLCLSGGGMRLDELRLGGVAPVIVLNASTANGLTPLSVDFDAQSSSDPDGTIVSFDWDWEGDGVYDEVNAAALVNHLYTDAGSFQPTLRVSDDSGIMVTQGLALSVESPWVHSLGSPGAEQFNCVAVDAITQKLYCAGTVDIAGSTVGQDILVACYSFDGALNWAEAIGLPGADTPRDIAAGAAGEVYVAGELDDPLSLNGTDALLLKLGGDGSVDWTSQFSTAENDSFSGVLSLDGEPYVAGSSGGQSFGGTDLLSAHFNAADGSLDFCRAWGTDTTEGNACLARRGSAFTTTGYYLAGASDKYDQLGDVVLLRYGLDGLTDRADSWGSASRYERPTRLLSTNEYGLFLCGQTFSSGSENVFALSFSTDLGINFQRQLGSDDADFVGGLSFNDGRLSLAGYSDSAGLRRLFIWTLDESLSVHALDGSFPVAADSAALAAAPFPGGGLAVCGLGGSAAASFSQVSLSRNDALNNQWLSRNAADAAAVGTVTQPEPALLTLDSLTADSGAGAADALVLLHGEAL